MTGSKTDQPQGAADATGVLTAAAVTIICLVTGLNALMGSDRTAAVWALGGLLAAYVTVWWYVSRNGLLEDRDGGVALDAIVTMALAFTTAPALYAGALIAVRAFESGDWLMGFVTSVTVTLAAMVPLGSGILCRTCD